MASANGNSYSNGNVNGSVVCLGEMLVDFVPTSPGLTLAESKSYEKAPGGAPANVAVAVSRLGGKSAMIGKVGDDSFGHMLVQMLIDNGVDSRGIRLDAAARTALAFVTLRSDGEREFMFYRNPSADMLLHESELHREIISHSSIFHFGSISLIAEPCKSAHLAAMEIARESGAILSYDVNLRLALWPSAKEAHEGIMSLWEAVDIIKVSDNELEFLLENGSTDDEKQKKHRDLDEAVRSVWRSNLKLLLLTEGRHGCRYYTQEFHGRVEGIEVEPVDTTGAGDAFMGGFLFQLSQNTHLYEDEKSLRGALVFANACGAIATMERGAIPALPCQESVLRLIHNRSMGRSGSVCTPHEQKHSNGSNNAQSNGEPTMA